MQRNECFNKTQLKERGWTESIIKKLIDIEPYEFRGMYRNKPQKCYPIKYIEELEQTEEFRKLNEKYIERKSIAEAAADVKREENLEILDKHLKSIKVKRLDMKWLERLTLESKQEWYFQSGQYDNDVYDAPENVKQRWMVNYIRHNLTEYDSFIYDIFGKVGKNELYLAVNKAIYEAIELKYPELKDEAARQLNNKCS